MTCRLLLRLSLPESVQHTRHHLSFLLSTQHHIHSLYACHLNRFELCIAPRDHHQCPGMVAHQAVYGLPAFLVGHFRDAACVDDAHISHLSLLCRAHPSLPELLSQGGGFGEVQFASQREIGRLPYSFLFHIYIYYLFGYKGTNKRAKIKIDFGFSEREYLRTTFRGTNKRAKYQINGIIPDFGCILP